MGRSGQCPSCGRFVGPYERCPYCGADVGRRLAVRAVKYGSLLLAVVGVLVLLLVARRSTVPMVEIGRLVETMNWAYVRVTGTVTRQPAYEPETGTLTLWLGDGTGEILVTAYRPEAEWLLAAGRVPVMGDGVTLEGTLRIKDEFQYLVLNVPEHAEIRPAEATTLPIGQVDASRLYQKVTVQGVIRDDRTPYEGLRILTLRDASGEIDVTLGAEAAAIAGPWPDLQVGQPLQVTGAVGSYGGTPQISVGRASDLVPLAKAMAIAPEQRIGALPAAAAGDLVVVTGTVTGIHPFSAGVRCTLDDGSGAVTLLLWQDLYASLDDSQALVEGTQLRVLGELAEYHGELEIVPELPSDVTVVAVAAPTVVELRLGELTTTEVGHRVAIQGLLTSLQRFSAGVKGTLDDGTGTATLLLWQEVYDGLPDPASLVVGAMLRAEGVVDEYQGELEVVPQDASGVEILSVEQQPTAAPTASLVTSEPVSPTVQASTPESTTQPTAVPTAQPTPPPTARPTAPPTPVPELRTIAAITSSDQGATLTIAQAGITEVDYFSQGVKYTLTDATGRITLLVWQDIMEQIAGRHDLFAGSQVRVSGEIDEYQGSLEIVPHQGADVVVLNRGQRLPIEARAVGNITPADEGRVFVVEGKVTRTEGRGWLRLWLADGTGEILIFVPERVVGYLPPGIGPGVRLRVTGEVDLYQGQLEIIPLAGADVEVR